MWRGISPEEYLMMAGRSGRGMIPGLVLTPGSSAEIIHQIECLRGSTQETGDKLRKMEQEQESFAHIQHLQAQAQTGQNMDIEKKLR